MPASINPDLAIEICDLIVDRIDVGSTPAVLEIYEGAQPSNPTVAPTGPLLVSIPLPNPSFDDAVAVANGATAEAFDIDPVVALNGGIAGFFRITTRDGTPLLDGSVSDLSGTGMLKLSSTTVIAGVNVVIGSLKITQRAF